MSWRGSRYGWVCMIVFFWTEEGKGSLNHDQQWQNNCFPWQPGVYLLSVGLPLLALMESMPNIQFAYITP